MSGTQYPDNFPSSPNHGDIHIYQDEMYVWDSSAPKADGTGAWRRNESEVDYIDYLKQITTPDRIRNHFIAEIEE